MKLSLLTLLSLLFTPLVVVGQINNKFEIPAYTYKFSHEITEGLSNETIKISRAAEYYSYIGEYQKALSVPNELDILWGFDTLSNNDLEYFNEFVAKILQGLYDNGYKYFGLEALSNCEYLPPEFCDSLINKRGYPLNSPVSGTYVTEPQMSNLIIQAMEIGFEIFAYEKFGKNREEEQAKFIADKLKTDPESKILILCGWYHILEEMENGKNRMAYHLRQKTGVNPFTIYQDLLIERHCTSEHPLMEKINFKEPKLFINKEGEYYNGRRDFKKFDALIYHPRTKYISNRPNWLLDHADNRIFPVEIKGDNYPYLVKAFPKERNRDSVPSDIIELKYKEDKTVLVLPSGKYILEIVDKNRNISLEEIEVK